MERGENKARPKVTCPGTDAFPAKAPVVRRRFIAGILAAMAPASALLGTSTAHAIVVRPIESRCEEVDLMRPVTTVTSKSLVGAGSFTVAFGRETPKENLESAHPGTPVEIVRCLPPGRLVQLAQGRIDRVEKGHYQASVFVPTKVAQTDPAQLTQSLVLQRNLYWQPMAGDFVRVLTPRVATKQRVWPRFSFSVSELFETRPSDERDLLSLSEVGRQRLVEAFKQLEEHPGRFIVEGVMYTPTGNHELALELSQMRAGMVASYLAQVFELRDDRMVARGLGRSLGADPGFRKVSRAGPNAPLIHDLVRIRALPLTGEDATAHHVGAMVAE